MVNVQEILDNLGAVYQTQGTNVTPGWVNICCPYCPDYDPDPSYHLGINPATGFFHCWRCKKKGTIIKIIYTFVKSPSKARDFIAVYLPLGLPSSAPYNPVSARNTRKSSLSLPAIFDPIKQPDDQPRVRDFFARRGFDPATVLNNYRLYYGGVIGDFKFRVIFPVFYKKNIVTYLGRTVVPGVTPEYRNLSDDNSAIPIKSTLYGWDELAEFSPIIVVEGILDRMRLGKSSVATYGTKWTSDQVLLLKEKNPTKLVILFDNEPEAQKSAKELAKAIWFCQAEVRHLTEVNDPGDLTDEQAAEVVQILTQGY